MKDEYLSKAALAIHALANRTASAGKKDEGAGKPPKWVPMPYGDGRRMDPGKLREAAAYYEIAESLHAASVGGSWTRALLLESMGEWDEAIALFDAMPHGREHVERCRRKQSGTYDPLDDLSPDARRAMEAMPDADAFFASIGATGLTDIPQAAAPAPRPVAGGPDEDPVAAFAQAFVEALLDRDWAAAKARLHPKEKLRTQDIKDYFEGLFMDDETFPTTCSVFDVQTGEDFLKQPGDVAYVYVTIDSENAEAVSMTVCRHGGELRARDVEFGRP